MIAIGPAMWQIIRTSSKHVQGTVTDSAINTYFWRVQSIEQTARS